MAEWHIVLRCRAGWNERKKPEDAGRETEMITKAHSSSSEQGEGWPISEPRMQIEMGISRAATHCGPAVFRRRSALMPWAAVCRLLFPAL